ncbi:unnamed protein product [Ascophyllum nodosum]
MTLQGVFHENPWLLFFDKLLAIALRFFAEVGIDTLVLEVGIGGKYDSTNFFRRPAIVSVITSISYDHQVSFVTCRISTFQLEKGFVKSAKHRTIYGKIG